MLTLFVFLVLMFGGSVGAVQTDDLKRGAFSVKQVDTRLGHSGPGRQTGHMIYHPSAPGPFPLIVFSHAALGSKENFASVSRHWASHGYVVLHPSHDDSGITIASGNMAPTSAEKT